MSEIEDRIAAIVPSISDTLGICLRRFKLASMRVAPLLRKPRARRSLAIDCPARRHRGGILEVE